MTSGQLFWKQNHDRVGMYPIPPSLARAAMSSLMKNQSADLVVVQPDISTCGVSRQSTGCWVIPGASSMITTLREDRLTAFASEKSACLMTSALEPPAPLVLAVTKMTSGWRKLARRSAHAYHARHADV